MGKAHVKKGDEVVVIAGSELGKRGKILEIRNKRGRALVEGLKMIKRHTKKGNRQEQSAIIEREGLIHLSNLMLASKYDARAGAAQPDSTPAKS
jgi:large subunit ribosomal protein L24